MLQKNHRNRIDEGPECCLFPFVTLMLASKTGRCKGRGIDVLVQTDVTLMLIGVELLAGSGLVYFTPRKKVPRC